MSQELLNQFTRNGENRMKIYKFSFSTYRTYVIKEVLEVEEKPKTYMTTNTTWKTRINKSDIGKVNAYDNVYLLEDDEKKARELFCEKLRSDIHQEQERIKDAEKEIVNLENLLKELSRED